MKEPNIDEKKLKKKLSDQKYREKNKEKIAQKKRDYYQLNKHKINSSENTKKARSKFYHKNKEKISLDRKKKRLENLSQMLEKERIRKAKYKKNNREKYINTTNLYFYNKLKNDPYFKIKHYYRNCFGKIKRKKGFSKESKTAEYLGCDWNSFKEYIESLFENWMTWDNWGVYDPNGPRTWNIDHIVPLAKFDFSDQEQINKAFHYTNCRPYCSKANLIEQHHR